MFALDAFDGTHTSWEQLGHFFMHLIPSFVLLLVFFVANKWEMIGGILFTSIGVALSPVVFSLNYSMNQSVGMSFGIVTAITGPFIVAGILFIVSSRFKKNEPKQPR
jgi:Na+/proline symporter